MIFADDLRQLKRKVDARSGALVSPKKAKWNFRRRLSDAPIGSTSLQLHHAAGHLRVRRPAALAYHHPRPLFAAPITKTEILYSSVSPHLLDEGAGRSTVSKSRQSPTGAAKATNTSAQMRSLKSKTCRIYCSTEDTCSRCPQRRISTRKAIHHVQKICKRST